MLDPLSFKKDKDKVKKKRNVVTQRAVVGRAVVPHTFNLLDGRSYEMRGRWTVFIFYPGDFTPVCTKQWCHYRDHQADLKDVQLIGVTSGDAARHQDFKNAYQLPFQFADDSKGKLVKLFFMQGRVGYVKRGIAIVDPRGILRYCKNWTLGIRYPSTKTILELLAELKD